MSEVHVLITNLKHYVHKSIHKEIEELICIVKYVDGSSEVLSTEATFEFKCTASKLLDYDIKQDIEFD